MRHYKLYSTKPYTEILTDSLAPSIYSASNAKTQERGYGYGSHDPEVASRPRQMFTDISTNAY